MFIFTLVIGLILIFEPEFPVGRHQKLNKKVGRTLGILYLLGTPFAFLWPLAFIYGFIALILATIIMAVLAPINEKVRGDKNKNFLLKLSNFAYGFAILGFFGIPLLPFAIIDKSFTGSIIGIAGIALFIFGIWLNRYSKRYQQ